MDERKPSEASHPDLDWSQVRETIMLLNLAVAQIERAMKEGDESVNVLAEMFTSLVGNVQVIGSAAKNLPDDTEQNEKGIILSNFKAVSEKVNSAIVAFQFYDMLAQRLTHVCNSLGALRELIDDSVRLYNPHEWYGLQEMIKSKYRIASDRAMFDAVLKGASLEEALAISEKEKEESAGEEDVELF